RLQVVDRDAVAPGDYRNQAAVCVAEDQQAVGPMLLHHPFPLGQDLPHLGTETVGPDSQGYIRRPDGKLIEEDGRKPVLVVLSGMNQHVLRMFVEERDDSAQPDDLGSGPEHGHHPHRSDSVVSPTWSTNSPWRCNSAVVASR